MAIVINSLTPTNPSTSSGGSVTFVVDAYETSGSPLTYIWQYSQDGNLYTTSGLVNNTSSTYTTSNLTINQNGLYFRVAISDGTSTIYSDQYPGIGNRIVSVVEDPSIVTNVNPLIDFYPDVTGVIVTAGQPVSFTMSASLVNADITTTSLVSNINIQWQYSSDSGSNWTTLSAGGDVSILEATSPFDTTPVTYYKYSTLQVNNTTFEDDNLKLYRAVITYPGAVNTPIILQNILVLVDPEIVIYRQPGEGDDTQQFKCYKTSDTSSGKLKVQVAAFTTANTSLSFSWDVLLSENGEYVSIIDLLSNYNCILKPGTTSNSDVLEIERMIFYNVLGFRCTITGESGESSVISDTHYIYPFDSEVNPILENTTYEVVEDLYGDIPDRLTYINESVRNVIINATLDVSRNTGLNGDVSVVLQKFDADASIWNDVGDAVSREVEETYVPYTLSPSETSTESIDIQYVSPPLRRESDDGSRFRLKITSSSIFSIVNNQKVINPYYSDEIILNVYRSARITTQPSDTTVFSGESTSFAVISGVTSGSLSDLSYQWQYNTQNISSGWQSVPSSSKYVGVNTNSLIVNDVNVTESYRFFRCVVSVTNQLFSVTSNVAQLTTRRDIFREISSLSDYYVNEFDTISWEVTASSLSTSAITYQWEYSQDYNPNTFSGNWSPISGYNTNTYEILSVTEQNTGYYRLRLTSSGGEIDYTNAAYLQVSNVDINIINNIPSSITVLENLPNSYSFSCLAFSTTGTGVNYQWEIKRLQDSTYQNIGNGYLESSDNKNTFAPLPFDKDVDEGAKIRCKISCDDVPFDVYTNECQININRVFSYFPDSAVKNVTIGSNVVIDLNPSWTGGTPTFSWEQNIGGSWSPMGESSSSLFLSSIDSSYNGRKYRCLVTLPGCNQHQYTRNGTTSIVNVSSSAYTLEVSIATVSASTKPKYYSTETQKTGASIGTVICVAKPDDYIHNPTETSDDTRRWKVSHSGSLQESNASSVVTSGSVYSSNKPSWASSSYTSPKWELSNDRFKGYLEMRGQYLKAKDFPELARMFGNTYGGNASSDIYPRYNDTHVFRMPNLYGKKLLGTGNVNNNSGSVSITPEFGPDGLSGGDKNVPGSIGGRYNYGTLAQLPPGSPGIVGGGDGQAGNGLNPETFSLGSFKTTGVTDSNAFVQPTFSGNVSYSTPNPGFSFTQTPVHTHTGLSVGFRNTENINMGGDCRGTTQPLASGRFVQTEGATGVVQNGPHLTGGVTAGQSHQHSLTDQGPGRFSMTTDAGMTISDTTIRLSGQSTQIFNNNLRFYLRNNENIPITSPYFRLKYLIKAY